MSRRSDLGLILDLPSVQIVCQGGPDKGKLWRLEQDVVTLGSGPDCDIVLVDNSISRRHARIKSTSLGWHIEDLESSNGTFLEAFRITGGYLTPGIVFRLGESRFEFHPRVRSIGSGDTPIKLPGLRGRSRSMKELFGLIEKLAGRQVSIALTGPTGSGKGVIARAIHQVSPRSKHPFIVLDCANQDPNLVRSELFGHVRGSFTGANQDRAGVFEAANGGTLFIDEIGELSQELQPRLLRVLEDRQVVRIGSHVPVDVNVRIVSATHRDLYQMVDDGDFRQDLLYRLCVVELEVPPLAARLDDLEDLCHGFLEESGEEGRIPLDSAIIEKLSEHTWPGNVRELRNVIERALAYAGEDPLNISHISYRSVAAGPIRGSIQDSERDLILRTLQETDGNKTETARKLNIAYTTLKRRIHKYGLDED